MNILNLFPHMEHLLVRARGIGLLLFLRRKHVRLAHDARLALRMARTAPLFQVMPQFKQPQPRILVAYISDQFRFCFCVLVWMNAQTAGMTGRDSAILSQWARQNMYYTPTCAFGGVFGAHLIYSQLSCMIESES